jgi:hypothetical protein
MCASFIRFVMAGSVMILLLLTACSKAQSEGPGFIASYGTKKQDVEYFPLITLLSAPQQRFESRTDSGQQWNWSMGGTEGAAPDPRGLPEWIEFKWREVPKAWNSLPFEEWKPRKDALPIKTYRVYIKSRVPQEVVDEVMEAKRHRQKDKLSDKMLWLEFTWVNDEIKFGWRLTVRNRQGWLDDLRSGGDLIE